MRYTSFEEITNSLMDITDRKTREALLNINEAEQNSILLALTSKLYKLIIDKIDDIDFNDIPETKGDILKLHCYEKLRNAIQLLKDILNQYKQPTDCIDEIEKTLNYLVRDRELYMRGFNVKVDIIMTTYNLITLAIINSISYMIATTIEFVKNAGDKGFALTLDRSGIARTRDSLVYNNLLSFNKACEKGQIQNSFNGFIKAKVKNLTTIFIGGTMIALGLGFVVFNIIPMLRELAYYYYHLRTEVSQYFELQAELLETNIYLINNNDVKTIDDKKEVIKKQKYIAEKFRKISEFLMIDTKSADSKTDKQMMKDNKTYKINDVMDDDNPTDIAVTQSSDNSLF